MTKREELLNEIKENFPLDSTNPVTLDIHRMSLMQAVFNLKPEDLSDKLLEEYLTLVKVEKPKATEAYYNWVLANTQTSGIH